MTIAKRIIQAPPERVYRAWLDPELLQRWLAPKGVDVVRVEVQERVGGPYRIWHEHAGSDIGGFECELLEFVALQRLVIRWGFVGPGRTAGPVFDSLLTITFAEASGGETHLTLVHERLDDLAAAMPDVADAVAPGWRSTLDKLADAIEPTDADPHHRSR